MFAGLFRHRQHPAMVANQQTGHHDGDRCRQVQCFSQGIAAGHQRQCQQYLDLVVIDALQHPVGDAAGPQAKQDAADGFL